MFVHKIVALVHTLTIYILNQGSVHVDQLKEIRHANYTRRRWHQSATEDYDYQAMTDTPITRFLSLSLKTKFSHQKTSLVLPRYSTKTGAKALLFCPSVQFGNQVK